MCNIFDPHHWHLIDGSVRKVRVHKNPTCKRNPDSVFITDERIYRGVKIVWLEECCKCNKTRKKYSVNPNVYEGQKLPAEESK